MTSLQDRTRFEPSEVEPRIVERWLASRLYHLDPEGTADENYSIAIPPPNVTGVLHMGHALNGSVQDTLIRVFEGLPSFKPRHEGAFQGYVRTVLWNRIRDIARQYQRAGAPSPLDSELAGHEDSPYELALADEMLDRYETALERLRPEERDLIIARIEMGLPHAEIAGMFDKPSVAAVHMALSRALVRLAEEMAYERKR